MAPSEKRYNDSLLCKASSSSLAPETLCECIADSIRCGLDRSFRVRVGVQAIIAAEIHVIHSLVTIGLVTWNSASKLEQTMHALAQQDCRELQLIVVDNASKDRSVNLIREQFPDVQVISNSENRGFSIGHNQAIHVS